MSIHLKGVISVPAGTGRLDQPADKLRECDLPTQLRATYHIRSDTQESVVFNDMILDVQVPGRVREPRCKATMVIETPWLDSPQVTIDKMAEWLERLAKGMRDGTAQTGFGLEIVSAHPLKTPEKGDE